MTGISARIRRQRRLVGGTLATLGGLGTVLLMMVMNGDLIEPEKRSVGTEVAFDAPPPPPPPKKTRPKKKPKPKRSKTPPPPIPTLAAGLGGLDFGMPGLSGALDDATDALLGDVGDVVMTEDAVDAPPRPMQRVAPEFPARARARGVSGYVTLSLLVNGDGVVEDLRVLESEPAGVFDEAALMAMRQWRFQAATYEGRPVTTRVRQTLRFELE